MKKNYRRKELKSIESRLLCGPFQALEEEQMKDKIKEAIKLERTKIRRFKNEYPEYFN